MRGKSREEVTRVEKRCKEKNEMRKYIARKMHTNVNECERQLKEKGGFAIFLFFCGMKIQNNKWRDHE